MLLLSSDWALSLAEVPYVERSLSRIRVSDIWVIELWCLRGSIPIEAYSPVLW